MNETSIKPGTRYEVRPFREEDRARVVAIMNDNWPTLRHWSAEEWTDYDTSLLRENTAILRLVIGDPAIAFMQALDRSTTPYRKDGMCDIEIFVSLEHRRKGIGAMLFERAFAFAQERGARRLSTWFMEHGPDEPAIRFLQERGFVEIERHQPSTLDLDSFNPSRFAGVVEGVEQQGVHLFAYADIPYTLENRHKFYDLWLAILNDIPQRDEQHTSAPSFETWVKRMAMPLWTPQANILAEVDGKWIGFSQLAFKQNSNIAKTWTTGTLPECRGRGIATALKLRALEVARLHNYRFITTHNHEDNGPMLAINRKLGFVPDPPEVVYIKTLY